MADRSTPSRLNDFLAGAGLAALDPDIVAKFDIYLSLFIRWNTRLNLSSIRDPDEITKIHLVESIYVARLLPSTIASLLDFGSGGGLPGIPITLCCPGLSVTLAESQNKKAAFLQEAVRTLEIKAKVHTGRAEALGREPAGEPAHRFDCVILRAVDKMPQAVAAAEDLVTPDGWLALMTTEADLAELQAVAGAQFKWGPPLRLPTSDARILALGQKKS